MNKLLLGVCVIVFLLSSTLAIGKCMPTNGVLQAPYSANVPIIDGQWSTPSEWSSVSEYKLSQATWVAYTRLENNGTDLFMLVDFVSDQSQSGWDNLAVMFDTSDDGGNVSSHDDFRFYYQSGNIHVAQGTGKVQTINGWPVTDSAWINIDTPPEAKYAVGFSHTNDPYDNLTDHEIYELSIPLSFLTENKIIGFWSEVSDGRTSAYVAWPTHTSEVPSGGVIVVVSPPLPNDWGDISIGADPTTTTTPTPSVPEFTLIALLPLFAAVFYVAIKLKSKKALNSLF